MFVHDRLPFSLRSSFPRTFLNHQRAVSTRSPNDFLSISIRTYFDIENRSKLSLKFLRTLTRLASACCTCVGFGVYDWRDGDPILTLEHHVPSILHLQVCSSSPRYHHHSSFESLRDVHVWTREWFVQHLQLPTLRVDPSMPG